MRILFLILLIPSRVLAQEPQFTFEQDIPFRTASGNLSMPLAGGLNAVQFNTMDVNGDGQEDAVVWDRMGRCIKVFLKTSAGYRFSPDHEKLFPRTLSSWLLVRDFNGDGKKDLFTGDPLGMRAYVNISGTTGPVLFRRYHPGFPILTKGFTSSINLKLNENDVPAIDDLDGDGDLDILAANFTGNGFIEYHRNLSVERTGRTDSLQLERVTQAWGNIRECDCGLFTFTIECPPSSGRTKHAGGKALLTIDADEDGDKDEPLARPRPRGTIRRRLQFRHVRRLAGLKRGKPLTGFPSAGILRKPRPVRARFPSPTQAARFRRLRRDLRRAQVLRWGSAR